MDNTLDRNVARLAQLSIPRALGSLSLPIVLSNTLTASHQLVNTFWLGRLGSAAVAAVSVSFPAIYVLVSLGGGLSLAGSILVSQYAGARDSSAVNHVSAQTLLIVAAISAALSAIGYVLVNPMLRLMGIGAEIFEDSAQYMRVSFLGMVFTFIFLMLQSILRSIGQVKIPMYAMIVSVALNLALDPLFIFGWGMVPAGGVVGAAYATLVTQALVATVGFWVLSSNRYGVHLHRHNFMPDIALTKRVFLLGLPASIEQSMQALGVIAMTTMVSGFGVNAIAAYGISSRVMVIVLIPAFGISMATTTLVGQNIGAGNPARAKETAAVSAWYSFWLLTGAAAIVLLGAEQIVRFFVPYDLAVIREGAAVLRFMAVSFGLLGIQFSLIGALRGAGRTFMPLILTVIHIWIVRMPVAYALAHYTALGDRGLWYSFPVSGVSAAIVAVVLFRKHHWK